MSNRKNLVFLLLLLLVGSVFLCGCDDLGIPLKIDCTYDSSTGTWLCFATIPYKITGHEGFHQYQYTAQYCYPFKTAKLISTCSGKAFAPPSPSPSPSPTPGDSGHYYKITESNGGNNGGGGGGGPSPL